MSDEVQHWMSELAGMSDPGGVVHVRSPFDGAELATVAGCGDGHVEVALTRAYERFRDRALWLPAHERVAVLERTADLMAGEHEALARLAASEGGKPLVDSRVEVTRAIDSVRLAVEHLRGQAGQGVPMGGTPASAGRMAFTRQEPVGVVVAVSAFNHPLNLIVHQVAPAVAAGCPVIVKPATVTPLSCLRFVDLLREAGLPPAWAQAIVLDDDAVAERLVTDARVGFFSFIGSARVGWSLRSKLAPGSRCALEHGGAAPVVLAADADLDLTVASICKGGFYHAGQVCVSVQRVFALPGSARPFASALARAAGALTVGDPLQEDTDVGPLIRSREVDRVETWVRAAIDAGAECLAGGHRLSATMFEPTVLLNPPADAEVSRSEIFGPVICVYESVDLGAALAAANDLPTAFQAAVFTRDIDTALAAFDGLDASAVMVNDHTAFRVDGMPFAGLRQSGLGVGGIPHTLADMQIEKMLVVRLP